LIAAAAKPGSEFFGRIFVPNVRIALASSSWLEKAAVRLLLITWFLTQSEFLMAKFLFVYRDSTEPRPQPSPDEMQSFLAMWGKWFEQFATQIVDGGDGLLPTGRVLQPSGEVVNGPYVEAKEMVGGFSVIEADHYEAAVEIAKHCPISKIGGAIEIREFAGYN
jgi:hypothetical protein